ncbi:major head protein [Pseudomonas phage Psa21]|uniref:Major capsid protein n=1 Tax=Pseudomonas phage Psa21 TaxID=2530023 RepID=A0A481W606_9CAUD|nr:major head protein [Pseudomonas phage Psa21]QBJ02697.1 major capsid protein [Pseudomonas phage Psa21]
MNLDSLFKHNVAKQYTRFSMEDFLGKLETEQNYADNLLAKGKSLVEYISQENFGDINEAQRSTAGALYKDLGSMLKTFGFEYFDEKSGKAQISENQQRAAAIAAIACADPEAYKKALRSVAKEVVSNEDNVFNVRHEFAGPAGSLQVFQDHLGLENYNEKSQRDFRVVTVGYNLEASRQDEFAERLYPTTVVNPVEGGVVQVLPYIAVMKDVYHAVSGQKLQNEEVNMVEAYRDPSILDDNCTDLIPAVDPDGSNLKFFTDPTVVPHHVVTNEQNMTITTGPLKPNVKIDLMGNSNANLLINKGMLDISDTIDPSGRLKALYVKFDGKIIRFVVDRLPTAVFQPGLIGDTRQAKLDFITEDLVVGEDTKAIDGTVSANVQELVNRKWTARISVSFNGHVSTSRGDARYGTTGIEIDRIVDEDRKLISIESGDGKDLVDAIGELEVVGYDLDLKFTNTNRRQRGHLLQTRAIQFRHPIPMHAPVTLPMSTMDEQGPGDVVKALTVNTNIRNSNNAVKRLLNYLAQLKEVVGNGYDRPKFGAVEGALSIMMRPTYREGTLHLPDHIDTLKSQDRWQDVCSTILNYAKGILFPAYRESNIEAAFRVISGNQDEKPMFIFATDKEIGNYLMTQGDDRTLGAILEYDLVTTNNELFDGKLVIVPTRKNPTENDILSFGQFFYVSTVIADLPITRGGQQVTREIAAVPFNLHVNNIPFAINLTITGLEEVMGKSQWNKPLISALAA